MSNYYYCEDCKEIFRKDEVEVKQVREVHWWLDDNPVEIFCELYCPVCGSVYIEEAESCDECGEVIIPSQDGLCEECRKRRGGETDGEYER